MATPKQIEETLKEAEDLEKEIMEGDTGEESEPIEPPALDPDAPEPVDDGSPGEGDEPEPEEDLSGQFKELEHKFSVLEGKYKSEVPELHRRIKAKEEENRSLLGVIESLQEQPKDEPKEDKPPKFVTKEDREKYADDIPTIKRVAREEAYDVTTKILKDRLPPVEQRIDGVEQSTQRTTEGTFWAVLEDKVPDWRDVNQDQGFLAWLNESIPHTGRRRQDFLQDAHNALDARRVAEFFDEWKGLQAQEEVEPEPESSPSSLEKEVMPSKSGGRGKPPEPAKYPSYEDVQRAEEDFVKGNKGFKDYQKVVDAHTKGVAKGFAA